MLRGKVTLIPLNHIIYRPVDGLICETKHVIGSTKGNIIHLP